MHALALILILTLTLTRQDQPSKPRSRANSVLIQVTAAQPSFYLSLATDRFVILEPTNLLIHSQRSTHTPITDTSVEPPIQYEPSKCPP